MLLYFSEIKLTSYDSFWICVCRYFMRAVYIDI